MRRDPSMLAAGAVAIALALALAPPAGADQRGGLARTLDAAVHELLSGPEQTLGYWTQRRMRAASTPAERRYSGRARPNGAHAGERGLLGGQRFGSGRVGGPTARHLRTHGKIFFSIPGQGDYACSGTVVRSPSRSLVMTAGHCAFDERARRPVTRLMFVPAYEDGSAPFGRWPARRIVVPSGWASRGDSRFDLAFARVRPDGQGKRIQQVVGGRPIRFGSRGEPVQAFGYPAADAVIPILPSLRFDGERPWACSSPYAGDDNNYPPPRPLSIACDMGSGASGGAWLNSRGRIVSVTAYGYLLLTPNRVFGPFLGPEARQAYRSVRGKRRR